MSLSIDKWLNEIVELCQPSKIHICTGTSTERESLIKLMVDDNQLIKLNERLRPNSYLARSDPSDVARLEKFTYVCTKNQHDAGPNNNWSEPSEMKAHLINLMTNTMIDKTMYVIPFVMGPLYDQHSIYGVQVTDSPYVTVNMSIMTKMGTDVYNYINNTQCEFIKCIHSTGSTGSDGWTSTTGERLSLKWYSNATKYIVHFPEELSVYSYGSGYGGNALLGKKSVSLRIASYMGRQNNWLAEHMLLIKLIPPNQNPPIYLTGAFPSACGKTNLALLKPVLDNWKVETLGDDITWIRPDNDGQLYGINPETGFFGVAPGTSEKTNPNAMATIASNTIFTNVALTSDGDVWWEGLTETAPADLMDWKGHIYSSSNLAAHPNSRFTVPITNCPILCEADVNKWVPISAILFGGKRTDLIPLVRQSLSWNHGVYMGSTICSQQTAAAEGIVGELRYDPFAMLPFCGYNMGDYFKHWIKIGAELSIQPKIFYVNWFKKDANGKFLWPGFSHNIHVLKWIYQRIISDTNAIATPIGYIPENINLSSQTNIDELFEIDAQKWIHQLQQLDQEYLSIFGDRLPHELIEENRRMVNDLKF